MEWTTTYNDLCNEIDILELRSNDLSYQLKIAHRCRFGGTWRQDGQTVHIPLDKGMEAYDKAAELLNEVLQLLEHKKETKAAIEQRMDGFETLEHRVMIMRDIQRKPLTDIADELGYSYDWIRKVSGRVKRVKFDVNAKKGTIKAQIG